MDPILGGENLQIKMKNSPHSFLGSLSNEEKEFESLNQLGAFDPSTVGFVIMDMLEDNDWDGDGEPDF